MRTFTAAVTFGVSATLMVATVVITPAGDPDAPDAPGTTGTPAVADPPPATLEPEASATRRRTAEAPIDVPIPPAVSLRPEVSLVGASGEQQIVVAEALARFRDAELALPALEIVFHEPDDGMEPCSGRHGLFLPEREPWRVLVCSELPFVLTHELAHAWERATLDDGQRAAYSAERGFEGWNPPDADWDERAIEDAAFVLQQNLMAGRVDPSSERWIELAAAYELLTGQPSPASSS